MILGNKCDVDESWRKVSEERGRAVRECGDGKAMWLSLVRGILVSRVGSRIFEEGGLIFQKDKSFWLLIGSLVSR